MKVPRWNPRWVPPPLPRLFRELSNVPRARTPIASLYQCLAPVPRDPVPRKGLSSVQGYRAVCCEALK
jgi:hypothetical protein